MYGALGIPGIGRPWRGSGRVTGKDISHQYVNLRQCPALRELRADAPGGSYLASGQVHRPDDSLGPRCQCPIGKTPAAHIPELQKTPNSTG